jgi:hypothetical protein
MKSGFSSQSRVRNRFTSILFLWVLFTMGILLTGCTSIEQRQANALRWWNGITGTASGAVQTGKALVEQGKETAEELKAAADDIGHRVESVQEGIGKIQEGKKLIDEGLKGTGSTK